METLVRRFVRQEKLQKATLVEIKRACKTSNELIDETFKSIMKQFDNLHSQVRYYALELAHILFERSSHFRTLVIDKGLEVLRLTIGELESPLPEPYQWAAKLERRAEELFRSWHSSFFEQHPQMQILIDHMEGIVKDRVYLDSGFLLLGAQESAQKKRVREVKLAQYLTLLKEEYPKDIITLNEYKSQLRRSLELLIPNDEIGDKLGSDSKVVNYGLVDDSYNLTIVIPKVNRIKATEDNKILLDSVRENRQILLSYQAKVDKWLVMATKAQDPDKERNDTFLKSCIDLKVNLTNLVSQSRDLLDNLIIEEDSEDEEDFEEVTEGNHVDAYLKAKAPAHVPPVVKSFTGLKPVFSKRSEAEDPTLYRREEVPEEEAPAREIPSHLKELFAAAPMVSFDRDLEFWGRENVTFAELSKHSGLEFKHRYLGEGSSSENKLSTEAMDDLKKRLVYVETKTDVVLYPQCRALLRTGNLCQRRDMVKCPVHGIIKPRDSDGIALDGKDDKLIPVWEQIADDVAQHVNIVGSKKRGRVSQLDPIVKPKKKVHDRLLRTSKRLSKNGSSDNTSELAHRDRFAFRW